jgi:uncharacterized membrane protein
VGESILQLLAGVPGELQMLVLSAVPLTELRASIPIAFLMAGEGAWAWPWWKIYLLAVAGNLIPVPFIIWALGPVSGFLRRWKLFDRFFDWLFERTRRRAGPRIERYRALGLSLFVAIPLPVTGAWTGSLAAFLFRIPARLSIPAIALGVLIAGALVTLIVTGALAGLGFLLGGQG